MFRYSSRLQALRTAKTIASWKTIAFCLLVWNAWAVPPATAQVIQLARAATPADNPLKGLVPYSAANVDRFPHSLEFFYVPLHQLMIGPDEYDWSSLEKELTAVSNRGCQAVLRIWIEYPGLESGLPNFLKDQGVKITEWTNEQETPPKKQFTPDYEDERLISAMERFIKAFGQRYDSDPRLGYITAGLLGEWGEWHTWPRDELFASKKTQQRVLMAYQQSFQQVPILLRYPAGEKNKQQVANSSLPFGYHDDSFAWGTLSTGDPNDFWYYMTALSEAGQGALEKWKKHPIGGEIRPEIWGEVFDETPSHPKAQDFAESVRQTHATWLLDSGMFNSKQSDARVERAKQQIQKMGYDFWVKASKLELDANGAHQLSIAIVNEGVAPFYRDWKIELGFQSKNSSRIRSTQATPWSLKGIMPDDKPTILTVRLDPQLYTPEDKILLRVVNPLVGGKTLQFANQSQNQDQPGWLTVH